MTKPVDNMSDEEVTRENPNGLVLHDARHTPHPLLESKVSPKTVQEWMGQSDKAFVLYYSDLGKKRANR